MSTGRAAGLWWGPVVLGVLLGVLDFLWIKFVPFPLGGLGNSSAVWAVAAFFYAYFLGRGWRSGVLGSVALLVIAVPCYYVTATVVQGDDLAGVWSPGWTLAAVIAGCVFGLAGSIARSHPGTITESRVENATESRAGSAAESRGPGAWQVLAIATPVAVLFAEAGLLAGRIGDPSYDTADTVGQAAVEVVAGVLVVVLVRTTWRRRAAALLVAAPFAVLGFGLFRAAGFA